jgi:hypothetical protein
MEQLTFLFTTKIVKLKGQSFLLDDWHKVLPREDRSNWSRRLVPDDGFSCVELIASWALSVPDRERYHWVPYFLGKDLAQLNDIYRERFYPDGPPSFWDVQIQEAKQHVDQFLSRVNAMSIYL